MEVWENLLNGFGANFKLFVITLALSLPLGLLISLCTMSKFKPLRYLMKTFVWIIRGTPLMLQLFVIMYAPGILFDRPISERFMVAVVAFVINYAAYFSEIYRGGIESISKGQYEAGQVLGLTKIQVFFKVILFQVIKRITPSMGNEVITLVKDTSLARMIGVVEIIRIAERDVSRGVVWPFFATGLYFLLFTGVLSMLFSYAEKRLNYYRG